MIRPLLIAVTAALLCPGCGVTTHVIPRSADARINAYGERFRARVLVIDATEPVLHFCDSLRVEGSTVQWADVDSVRWLRVPWKSVLTVTFLDRFSGALEGGIGTGVAMSAFLNVMVDHRDLSPGDIAYLSLTFSLLGAALGSTFAHRTELVLGSPDVRTDVLAAVADDGRALEYASDSLRNDREVVLTAVRKHPDAIRFASKRLQEDYEIQSAVIPNPKSPRP